MSKNTKDRIIETSFSIFLKYGWDNVPIADVKKLQT